MSSINKDAKVTLVGAGPGDPDLMSLAGVKALKTANVVLYDALVNKEILEWAPKDAILVFVGKRLGYKRYTQDKINYLLVSYAMNHGHVVRLKGGDSFVFGRGSEEIESVQAFGIPTKVIPGISSVISAGASIGLPLTKRNVSHGFWAITATTQYHQLSDDIKLAAQSNSTVVILMGMSKLQQIVDIYKANYKGNESIAIIQNATLPEEKHVVGSINNIVQLVKENNLANPAVMIIGAVVNEYPSIKSNEILSLIEHE